MPFDGTLNQRLPPDLTEPSLEGLAYLLRHKKLWPTYFKWDFLEILTTRRLSHTRASTLVAFIASAEVHDCGSRGCAIGLACLMWPRQFAGAWVSNSTMSKSVSRILGMPVSSVDAIFCDPSHYEIEPSADVKPKMVANAIDKYLERNQQKQVRKEKLHAV
jgi:hypothetical protein